MKFHVILTTVADLSMKVEADDEDAALEVAFDRAKAFADQYHAGHDYVVSINETWGLRDPQVKSI